MRYVYPGMLFVLIVVAAAVCGCASGPASPAVTPKPVDVTAIPSPTPGPEALRAGSLFDTDIPGWFEYRLTAAGGVSDIRFDFTTAVISGITLNDQRITVKNDMPDMVVVMDRYYDPATGRQVGSRSKTTSAGTVLADQDVAAAYERCQSGDVAQAFRDNDWPLSPAGTEAVTAGGRSYETTKYAVGNGGEHGTAWVARGVPVPVKIVSGADGTTIWELTGWG